MTYEDLQDTATILGILWVAAIAYGIYSLHKAKSFDEVRYKSLVRITNRPIKLCAKHASEHLTVGRAALLDGPGCELCAEIRRGKNV